MASSRSSFHTLFKINKIITTQPVFKAKQIFNRLKYAWIWKKRPKCRKNWYRKNLVKPRHLVLFLPFIVIIPPRLEIKLKELSGSENAENKRLKHVYLSITEFTFKKITIFNLAHNFFLIFLNQIQKLVRVPTFV